MATPETAPAATAPTASAATFETVLATLQELITVTTSLKEALKSTDEVVKSTVKPSMVKKSELTAKLVTELTELNKTLAKTDGGGRKPRRSVKKGGSAGSPAVYNIQGLITERHDPYAVTRDPLIAAMTQLHAPFSAGVVGDTVQSPTADLPLTAIARITPMDGVAPPTVLSGGGKKKRAAAPKGKKAAK